MKIRIERSEENKDEIVVICGANVDTKRIERALEDALRRKDVIPLKLGRTECFVPVQDILFFETQDDRVTAHTATSMYTSSLTLRELDEVLPGNFAKAGKSCIVNASCVSAVSRNLTGPSEIEFEHTYKTAYVSRKYYKSLIEIIKETRS